MSCGMLIDPYKPLTLHVRPPVPSATQSGTVFPEILAVWRIRTAGVDAPPFVWKDDPQFDRHVLWPSQLSPDPP